MRRGLTRMAAVTAIAAQLVSKTFTYYSAILLVCICLLMITGTVNSQLPSHTFDGQMHLYPSCKMSFSTCTFFNFYSYRTNSTILTGNASAVINIHRAVSSSIASSTCTSIVTLRIDACCSILTWHTHNT